MPRLIICGLAILVGAAGLRLSAQPSNSFGGSMQPFRYNALAAWQNPVLLAGQQTNVQIETGLVHERMLFVDDFSHDELLQDAPMQAVYRFSAHYSCAQSKFSLAAFGGTESRFRQAWQSSWPGRFLFTDFYFESERFGISAVYQLNEHLALAFNPSLLTNRLGFSQTIEDFISSEEQKMHTLAKGISWQCALAVKYRAHESVRLIAGLAIPLRQFQTRSGSTIKTALNEMKGDELAVQAAQPIELSLISNYFATEELVFRLHFSLAHFNAPLLSIKDGDSFERLLNLQIRKWQIATEINFWWKAHDWLHIGASFTYNTREANPGSYHPLLARGDRLGAGLGLHLAAAKRVSVLLGSSYYSGSRFEEFENENDRGFGGVYKSNGLYASISLGFRILK